jgi:hypothetical protein
MEGAEEAQVLPMQCLASSCSSFIQDARLFVRTLPFSSTQHRIG